MTPTFERAITVAALAHAGAKDRAGEPYILHPLRVMLRVVSDTERTVAMLHDVVEDTDWTLDRLRAEGFSDEIAEAVDALTRRSDAGESYEGYIVRVRANPTARRVKIADLHDNLDMSRIPSPGKRDHERIARYERALRSLLQD